MRIEKVKKGDAIPEMLEGNGFRTVKATEPGVVIHLGSKAGFVAWKDLLKLKESKTRKELDV